MRGARPLLMSVLMSGAALSPGAKGCDAHAEPSVESPRARSQAAGGSSAGAKLSELPAPAGHYDPRSVRLAEDAPERAVRAALERGDRLEAQRLVAEALGRASDPALRGRLLWLSAKVQDDPLAGQGALAELYGTSSPLSRWAGLLLVERIVQTESPRAAALGAELGNGWAGAFRAKSAQAQALMFNYQREAAEPLLRTLLERVPESSGGAAVALPLADLLIAKRTRADLREAVALCRRVLSRSPTSDAVPRAEKLLQKALSKLPVKDRRELAQPSVEEELARGDALSDARRYDEAQALFERLLKRQKRDAEGRCKTGLALGKTLFVRKDRGNAAKQLDVLARQCKDPEIKAWARYYAGSSLLRTGDPAGASAQYDALLRDTPEHSLADDGLYQQAIAEQDRGDMAAMRKTLERQLARYPQGDMRGEARFMLAFDARARGDHSAALAHFDALLAEGAQERNEGAEGRAAYWRAKTLEALALTVEAARAYAAIAREWPLSYHAQQAIARLQALDPATAAALLAELTPGKEPTPVLSFAWRSELDQVGWKTAVELLRVGEYDFAEQEFRFLGVLGTKAEDELLWMVAATMHEGGAYPAASQLARSRLRAFREKLPRGRERQLWRIAYPRAYEPLIEQVASEQQVPAEFVRAVAREESSFNPEAVSTALAYGLIQLIRPTAKIHATALGLPSDPDALKRPEVNLR
ncbi:MAG TPA: transglycosylase SLT domain-containing protein, partial [Polyangiales bacterium]|nr:transglycosylase SLT domain-containing protein [Polyangiales bacterium]